MLYVDNTNGQDAFPGTAAQPLRTITQALHQAIPGTLILIAKGDYSRQSGEQFPLVVDHGVMLSGLDEGSVYITGGRPLATVSRGIQAVTVIVSNDSTLRGVTITNPESAGTGIWVETGQPTIHQCRLYQCQREGMVISASGQPIISHCRFEENRASGLLCLDDSRGIIEHNTFSQAEYGIAIGDRATPDLHSNTIHHNRTGVTIAAEAHPKLRGNTIYQNQGSGLVLLDRAQLDFGTEKDPGKNIIADNRAYNIQCQTDTPLVSHGNQVGRVGVAFPAGNRLSGSIILASDMPLISSRRSAPSFSSSTPFSSASSSKKGLREIETKNPFSLTNVISNLSEADNSSEAETLSFMPSGQPTVADSPANSPGPTLGLIASSQPTTNPFTSSDPPVSATSPSRFPDLQNHWAQSFIESLHQHTIIQGFPDGTFRPELSLTRAQYAALLHRMFSLPPFILPNVNQGRAFRDVSPQFWGSEAIQHASRLGFIAGFPDGTFRPEEALSRAQAIVSLVNGLKLAGVAGTAVKTTLERYGDRARIPNYAKAEIAIATHKHLIVNHPDLTQLGPRQPISRAEMATMLYQIRVITGQSVAIDSPYIIQPTTLSVAFADVPQPPEADESSQSNTHWAAAFIYGLANQQFISGSSPTTFAPERAVSRAEFAALLAQIFNPLAKQNIPLAQNFIDVPKRFWAHKVIQQVVQAGLMSGFDDGSFQPQQDVRRWQVFLSVTQALGLMPESGDLLHHFYIDVDSIPERAKGAIAIATTKHLVVNYPIPNRINASRGATRAEVAAILYQSLSINNRLPTVPSPYIVTTAFAAPPSPSPPVPPTPQITNAPGPQVPNAPTPQIANAPTPLLLPTALLSPLQYNHTVQDLESYLFGYTNQSNLITGTVAAQLRQQDIHVVVYKTNADPSQPSGLSIIPIDSEVMIRLQVTDQPPDQPEPEGSAFVAEEPDIEAGAWLLKILFEAQSTPGLELAQRMHSAILSRAGLADGGIQSTQTLWSDVSPDSALSLPSLTAITPKASVLIHLSPVTRLTEDYPPIPTTPIVWAIASTTVDTLADGVNSSNG